MIRTLSCVLAALLVFSFAPLAASAQDAPLLDGQVFVGMIGPAENPDLPDRLLFRDGQFWSDICTECGFLPGPYSAHLTDDGTAFSGTLTSEDRGVFDYEGLIQLDGTIEVNISWKRKRWYWTAQREIVFRGKKDAPAHQPPELQMVLLQIEQGDPSTNPRCARF